MAKKNEKKLNAAMAKQLKKMGFNCKSEEEAREQLLAALEKEGVDGMEEETLETLIDMVDGFRDSVEDEVEEPEEEEEDEEEVDEDEQDANDLADEVEAEDAATEEEADEESDEEPEDNSDDEEEEDEEPEEEVKPAKKTAKKAAVKKESAPKKKAETAKKTTTAKKTSSKRGRKIDPKNNEDDRKELISAFSKLFPEDTYTYAFVINGVSVKYIGKNSKRGVFLFDNLTRHEDGTITGNLYLNTMTKETDKLDELGIDYQLCWTKAPFIKALSTEEANEVLEKVYDIITSFVNKVDKRLGDNRKKMEESLEKTSKKATKKATTAKKEVAPEVDDEEEDDEVEEQPKKKPATKKAAAKKTTKK